MLCAKYGFGPSEDFATQTSDPSFCAIILGSRTQTSDPRICCANLGSADLLRKPRIRTQSSRIAQPNLGHLRQQTHDRSRTQAARHTRQRSHDRSRTQSSSAIHGNEPTLLRMAELLCMRDRSWVCCRGWPRFGCAILDDCLRIRGLRSKICGSEVCAANLRIRGLRVRSQDYCAKLGSEVCATKSWDGPNPYFAHNIYILNTCC